MMGEVIDDHHEVASYRELSSQDQAGTCSSAARQLRPIGVAKQRKGVGLIQGEGRQARR
jgi:hypothetical protein